MPYLLIFYRLILRPLRAEPVRTALTALAVALGVAVVLAIEMAGEAAAGSFHSSVETLAGKADYEITADAGVKPETLTALAIVPWALRLTPRIEDFAILPDTSRGVPLIGIDVLSNAALQGDGSSYSFSPDAIWVGSTLGWKLNQKVQVLVNDRMVEGTVRGLLPASAGEVIVADLSLADRWLGRSGMLDRILIQTPKSSPPDGWESILRTAVGSGVTVEPFGARTEQNRRMLAAFRWNLRILSYIALIVGAFLIYNTISVSVVRRRPEIGVLRALGATRFGVLSAFLGEAACFGLFGGVVGLVLGRVLAESAVRLIGVTVESLYVSSRPSDIILSPHMVVLGIFAGLIVTTASALAPAWEASRVTPVEAMSRGRTEHRMRMRTGLNLATSVILALCAFVASRQGPLSGKPVFGYLAALCLIAALAAGIAPLVSAFSSVSASAMKRAFGAEGLIATRSLAGSLRRTSVLAGALATAIAMTTAVGIMVGSFRQTVLDWMNDRLQADLYIRPAGPPRADRHPTMNPDSVARLKALPEVEAVESFRAYEITYQGVPATLGGSDTSAVRLHSTRTFVSGTDPQTVYRTLMGGGNDVIVSEAFANKHNVRAGDVLALRLGGEEGKFRVIDVYYDYASERGYIVMDRRTLLRYLPDPAPSNVGVYLKTGVALRAGRRVVQSALAGQKLQIFTNRRLRTEAIRTFDRTFAITYALEGIAVVVAVMGVAGALISLVIDRRREFGLLRFLGAATSQVRRLILFEAGLIGFLSSLAGLALGLILSLLLIFVINKQSFGWTIQFHLPVAVLLGAIGLVFVSTIAAAIYPGRIAARLNPVEVIHEE